MGGSSLRYWCSACPSRRRFRVRRSRSSPRSRERAPSRSHMLRGQEPYEGLCDGQLFHMRILAAFCRSWPSSSTSGSNEHRLRHGAGRRRSAGGAAKATERSNGQPTGGRDRAPRGVAASTAPHVDRRGDQMPRRPWPAAHRRRRVHIGSCTPRSRSLAAATRGRPKPTAIWHPSRLPPRRWRGRRRPICSEGSLRDREAGAVVEVQDRVLPAPASSIAWTVERLGSCDSAPAEIHSSGTARIVSGSTLFARIEVGHGGCGETRASGPPGDPTARTRPASPFRLDRGVAQVDAEPAQLRERDLAERILSDLRDDRRRAARGEPRRSPRSWGCRQLPSGTCAQRASPHRAGRSTGRC